MRTVALGDHVEILSGFAFKSERFNDDGRGLPLVRIRDVKPATSQTYYDGEYDSRFVLSDGDLLVGMDGEFNCARWAGGNALLNQRVCRVRAVSKFLDEQYLFWFLPKALKDIEQKSNFVTVKHLSAKQINEIEIPLPPLEEQKRIAAILDQADELRRKRQRALDRLNQLGQAIFIEMFVEGQGDEWPTLLVGQLVDESSGGIRTGPFGSQLLHSEFVDDGVAVLGIDNAVSNRFQWGQRRHITLDKYNDLKRYRVYPGDVIITIMGTCGRCAIVPPEIPLAINTKHLCCISLQRDVCAPEYLHSYFLTHPTALEYLRSKSKGAIMDGLNMGIVKAMPVKLPPFRLQQQFVENLEVIEEQRGAASEAAAIADQLFTSLQHRAFCGELTASSLKEAAA